MLITRPALQISQSAHGAFAISKKWQSLQISLDIYQGVQTQRT